MNEELFEKIVFKLLKENKQEQLKERLRTIFEYSEDEDFEKFFNLIIKSFYIAANNSGNKEKSKRVFDTILEMTEDIMALGAPDNFSKNFNEIYEKSENVAKQDPEWLKRSKNEIGSTKKPEQQEEKQKTSNIEERLKRADISVLNQLGDEWKAFDFGNHLVFVYPTKFISNIVPLYEQNPGYFYAFPKEENFRPIGVDEQYVYRLFTTPEQRYKTYKCTKAAVGNVHGVDVKELQYTSYWGTVNLQKGILEGVK